MKPLTGIRIVELAGLAPAPFAAMMLADHGAEVIRIGRAGHPHPIPADKEILRRGRAEILELDLKSDADVERVRALAREADGLVEGFRPGVKERLGLGPDPLCADNPGLVYGRIGADLVAARCRPVEGRAGVESARRRNGLLRQL